jgi:hypothetical protein
MHWRIIHHAGVAQGARDHLGAPIMPVQSRLGDQHTDPLSHCVDYQRQRDPVPCHFLARAEYLFLCFNPHCQPGILDWITLVA